MDIEPTTGCNFRCTMCQVSSPNFISKNLDYEMFKQVIDGNKQLLKIKLQGMGEPLVNNNFFNMVEYASKYSIVSEITTNGSLLNQNNILKLQKSNLSRITVSIDGATPGVFEKIRVKLQGHLKLVTLFLIKTPKGFDELSRIRSELSFHKILLIHQNSMLNLLTIFLTCKTIYLP